MRRIPSTLKIPAAVLLLLVSNTFALAQEPEGNKTAQEKITILLKAATDNQGPSSKSLTGDKIQQIRDIKKQLQRGGFSDGGGNAIGTTLFDFYENNGSQELSIVELLDKEPLAKKMILALDSEVPAVGHLSSLGFGSLLLASVQDKKIFLESKNISSAGCQNQSMVAASQQRIVACQSDIEIRFNAEWLKKANSKNRAGLIMHEMILGWARNQGGDKAKTEAAVRRLNRLLFATEKSQYAQAVNEVFNVGAFSAESYVRTKINVEKSIAAMNSYNRTHTLPPSQQESWGRLGAAISSGSLNSAECSILIDMTMQIRSDLDINKICGPLETF